jgi:hypothetical protein
MTKHAAVLARVIAPLDRSQLRGAEIGVLCGETSAHLLTELPGLFLYMIDSWEATPADSSYRRSGDACARFRTEQHELNRKTAESVTTFAAERRTLLQMSSSQAAMQIPDGSLDFVFIDADHTYEAVQADLATWWPKLRINAILAGHDYQAPRDRRGHWGVKRAVDEFCAAQNLALKVERHCVWWCRSARCGGAPATMQSPAIAR